MFVSTFTSPRVGPRMRTAGAVAIAVVLALATVGDIRGQEPSTDITLVNSAGAVVERKKDGRFIARPIFDTQVEGLFYGLRDPSTGDWLTAVYRVIGGEKALTEGWEYSWEYPTLTEQPALDPERTYLLVLLVSKTVPGTPQTINVLVPIYEPGSLWERVIRAMDPARWARALALWIVEGVHSGLCSVVEKASDTTAERCRGH